MVPIPIFLLMATHLLHQHILPSHAAVDKYPYIDIPSNGILPKPVQYFHHPSEENQADTDSDQINRQHSVAISQENRSQQARFGLNYGNSYTGGGGIDGYSTGSSLYSPTRIDFGGLIIGAVVGLAALIIIPKIFHLFLYGTHYPNAFGSYGRSDLDVSNATLLSPEISNILSRIDDVITYNQMDSSACLQRAVCSYIGSVNARVKSGELTALDSALDSTFSNSIVSFLIDGSKFKTAVMLGKRGENCAEAYPKCTLFEDSMTSTLKKVLFG